MITIEYSRVINRFIHFWIIIKIENWIVLENFTFFKKKILKIF